MWTQLGENQAAGASSAAVVTPSLAYGRGDLHGKINLDHL
jgi:hypothetical protein